MPRLADIIRAALLLASLAGTAHAQQNPRRERPETPAPASAAEPDRFRLPPDSLTHHTLELPGRTLHFTATAGAVQRRDNAGKPESEIAFVAYTLDGADPTTRPVSFVMNGGPGYASAWLHLGALGPWRLPMTESAGNPSARPVAAPNPDTWLDFTDLVFLDPIGTGYSRLDKDDEALRKHAWSVNGDIETLTIAIRAWLVKYDRVAAPHYIVGESYGGFRAPRLAQTLQTDRGIGVTGIVMLSPLLDYSAFDQDFDVIETLSRLPSYAAVNMALHGGVNRAALAEAENYATGDYAHDLLSGVRNPELMDRMSARVAAITGLPQPLVRRYQARIGMFVYARELNRAEGLYASIYDPTVTRADPFPGQFSPPEHDPILDGLYAPMTSGMLHLYADVLNWKPDTTYRLLNPQIPRSWDYGDGTGRPESLFPLIQALALDPALHVLIAHGLYDLVTPYFATKLRLGMIPAAAGADRVTLETYEGGHMFYARDASRAAFRAAAARLYQ